ncbi:SRPBCC family protein [Sphaerisporangium sp. B11E5]|uniref:SRPBCC family protein n=1 Tax=Sphaerisporangium sp. B11E5 TaxID=3153563 RepID=UPI00325C6F57
MSTTINRQAHRLVGALERGLGGRKGPSSGALRAAITVNRPRREVYRFWHDLENLPRFMTHLESVDTMPGGYSRWKARGPANRIIEWDAEIVQDREDELISWRSLEGAAVRNRGSVSFSGAPGGRGTEVRVEMEYRTPGGRVGLVVARLFGEHPAQQVRDDLRRFKQVMETGEVARSEGSPEGTRALRRLFQHTAQPVR